MEKTVFNDLFSINVNEHVETKNGLNYLSWAWAWAEVKKRYPDASYEVVRFNGKPYLYDENLGYMVFTEVTINNETIEMWLPVMDNNNKAMLDHPYSYKTKYGEKTVEQATMFDINKTIMRCLVKCIGMHGLGLYIYSGCDLPEEHLEKRQEQFEVESKRWNDLRMKLEMLGCDFRDEKTNAYILKHSKVENQDIKTFTLDTCDKLKALNDVYQNMIDKKEKN